MARASGRSGSRLCRTGPRPSSCFGPRTRGPTAGCSRNRRGTRGCHNLPLLSTHPRPWVRLNNSHANSPPPTPTRSRACHATHIRSLQNSPPAPSSYHPIGSHSRRNSPGSALSHPPMNTSFPSLPAPHTPTPPRSTTDTFLPSSPTAMPHTTAPPPNLHTRPAPGPPD